MPRLIIDAGVAAHEDRPDPHDTLPYDWTRKDG
jgi:hypothetical protein